MFYFTTTQVQWVAQQHLNEHHKRDYKPLPDDILRALNDGSLLRALSKGILPPDQTGDDDNPLYFNDPMFPKQWYLVSFMYLI